MSNTPSSDQPNSNPYASPNAASTPRPDPGSSSNPLLVPGIILVALSASFVLLLLASLPGQIIRIRAIDTSTPEGSGELFGSVASLFAWTLMNLAVVLGSISMIRLKGYRSAMAAAICSVIPICSPCFVLGIPFGIWAIVLLIRPEVKQRFS